ncbi:hypothetical protein AB0425_19060 [Actinosynnema sp. NPDC051121]|nr:hypothetical protein [Saccharothrix sp.]
MLDAEGGGGAAQIGFVADTVSAGPAGAGLVASQTYFRVDLSQVQKLVDGLADARDRLQELYDTTVRSVITGPPGKDPYSESAATTIQQTAGPDPGGYAWANSRAIEALNTTMQNIQASLDSYKNQDQATTDAFNGGGDQS